MLKSCPWLWDALYDRRGLLRPAAALRRLYWSLNSGKILAAVGKIAPDVIVCTHAAPLSVLALGKRHGRIKPWLVACPTDHEIHSFWISPEVDLYLSPGPGASKRLAAAAIAPEKIAETGIPVDPDFGQARLKEQARLELGLKPEGMLFLLSGGSRGLGPMPEAAKALLSGFAHAQAAVLCGENRDLWAALKAWSAREPRLRLYQGGAPGDVRLLMAAADVFIGKAGGVSIAEAAASGLALIFWGSLPGQERRNERYWLKAKAALRAQSAGDLLSLVRAIAADPPRLSGLREKAAALGRPHSAAAAAAALKRLLAPRESAAGAL